MLKRLRFPLAVIGGFVGLVLLIPVLLLGVPFWITAAVIHLGRKIGARRDRGAVEWREAVEYEPDIGWKTRPNLDVRLSGPDGAFRVTTDGMGARGPVPMESAEMVVFGDSFAFGHGADDDFFFPYQDSGPRVVSFGADGYNLVQGLLWMERFSDRLRDKVVVWLVFYGNDLYDNLTPNHQHYRMPFVRETEGPEGWEVVTAHVDPRPWPFYEVRSDQRKLAEICSQTPLTRRTMSACEYLLRRGKTICDRSGARLVVLGVPEHWQLSDEGRGFLRDRSPRPEAFDPALPDKELKKICGRLGVRFTALSNLLSLEDHLEGDCHWNPEGHRKVAELLASLGDFAPSAERSAGTGSKAASPSRSRPVTS